MSIIKYRTIIHLLTRNIVQGIAIQNASILFAYILYLSITFVCNVTVKDEMRAKGF